MDRTLYALLVGIDNYPAAIPRLGGCVNDVHRMWEYLEGRFARTDGVALAQPLVLVDASATRQAVIAAFQKHLGRAKEGDVALFYFSGHGSQERSPREFWHLEPDKLDETLVCYDSRLDGPGHHDLADKELSFLIEQIAQPGVHLVVILDCCHSGSGTRDVRAQQTAVRRLQTDLRDRPIDSFLMTVADAERVSRRAEGGEASTSGWTAAGPHILLAACRDHEEAVEYRAIGADGRVEMRGTFSYFLGDALRTSTGPTTYRELFARASALVRSRVRGQSPQIESIPPGDLDRLLFDGALRSTAPFYTLSCRGDDWRIDGGAVHGLPPADPTDQTLLDVFPFETREADLRNASKATARVSLRRVEPAFSLVDGADRLDPGAAYKAVVASLPLPRIGVEFEPARDEGAALARQALATAQLERAPSLYLRKAGDGAPARFRLRAEDGGYVITSPENDRPLVARIEGQTPATARLAIQRLEHLAKWTLAAELKNSNTTVLPEDVALVLHDEYDQPLPGPDIRLEYRLDDEGRWQAPRFKIKLVNQSKDGRQFYCGLLDLTDTYAINSLLEEGCVRLGSGETYEAFQGKSVRATVPDKVWQQGVVEYRDTLKLIVCTQEFDPRLMGQGALDLPTTRATTRGLTRRGSLNRLMNRLQTRDVEVVSEGEDLDDWWATQVTFTTVRPQEATPVPNAHGRSVSLAGGVRLLDHPTLKAGARLSPASVTSRDMGGLALPRLLRDDPAVCLPFPLAATRGSDPGLSTLILTDVLGDSHTQVTPERPLRLQVPRGMPDGTCILAVGHDGEFFLPLGRAERSTSTTTELILERLPAPTSGGKVAPRGSIKIYFQKVVGSRSGTAGATPVLAAARIGFEGVVESIREATTVAQFVDRANSILLLVPGLLGDAHAMASGVLGAAIAERYDLILTFDHDNPRMPIAEGARHLGERLREVGLGAGQAKQLDVAAQSTGGLVARWFIEREKGHQVIRRLVMLGTPNAGLPWPRLGDWATTTLALGLNNLTGTPWPAGVLGGLTAAASDPRVDLRELLPRSPTLAELNACPDPGIPYTLLAGNSAILPAARDEEGLVRRLMGRLYGTNELSTIAADFFLDAPNDLAVAIESMTALAAARPPLPSVETACDHMTYFRSEASLAALARALRH